MPSRAATEVTIMPPDAEKTMDELLDEIDVLRASLTLSDELPGPQALGVSLTQPFSDLLGAWMGGEGVVRLWKVRVGGENPWLSDDFR